MYVLTNQITVSRLIPTQRELRSQLPGFQKIQVLGCRTSADSDSLSYRFRLSDGGEGGFNITHISRTQHPDAFGRFKPTSGSVLYIIEGCRKKILLTDEEIKEYYDYDYETVKEDYKEVYFEDYEGLSVLYHVEKVEDCNVIYKFDLGSNIRPEFREKHCVFCPVNNPFSLFDCLEKLKC